MNSVHAMRWFLSYLWNGSSSIISCGSFNYLWFLVLPPLEASIILPFPRRIFNMFIYFVDENLEDAFSLGSNSHYSNSQVIVSVVLCSDFEIAPFSSCIIYSIDKRIGFYHIRMAHCIHPHAMNQKHAWKVKKCHAAFFLSLIKNIVYALRIACM